MLRLVLLLIIVAAVGGYFTRPDEATMRHSADAVLSDPANLSQGLESIGATVAGDRAYDNYYVASKYTVSLDSNPVVQCWGAFTQVKCDRVQSNAGTSTGG